MGSHAALAARRHAPTGPLNEIKTNLNDSNEGNYNLGPSQDAESAELADVALLHSVRS